MIDLFDRWDALRIDKEKSTANERKIYEYQRLSPVPEIRLLRVLRRNLGTELQCELENFDLDKAPLYEAISYTWRDQMPTEKLLVNGSSLMVTPAVKEVVGYFQSFISQRYLWIDGVCINQIDDIEKSQQVPLMGEIYQRADRVVVWLGPQREVKDAYDARRVLCFLAYTWRHSGHDSQAYLRMLSNQRDLRWPAVVRLFSHPWFSRAWVVQELALPRTLHVIYGEICLDWEMIAATSRIMMDPFIVGITQTDRALNMDLSRKGRLVQLENIRIMGWIRSQVQKDQILSLGRVLGACIDFKAKYARDKIFSVLGIVVDGGHPNLAPNYTNPTAEVYLNTMRHIILSGNNRDIDIAIQFAGIGFQRSLEMQNLPSWVPDWSYPPNGRVLRDFYSIPEGPEEAINFMFTDAEHLLELGGVEIDRIGDLGGVFIEPIEEIGDMEEWVNSLCSLMQEAHVMAQACSKNLYPNEEAIKGALWQALKAPSGLPEREDNSTAHLAFIWQQFESFVDRSDEFPLFESPRATEFMIKFRPMLVILGRACGKRFCITEEGRMTLVPPIVEKGNLICYIKGLQMPIVLRKKQMRERKAAEHYELLGNCIIDSNIEMENAKWKWYTIV
ncbi:Heterokaryon incompatibility protein [Rutstroemia sp. NJR-2017a BBW]|nr:Heterokaryon incompatibility protein [Rutstroemia sp. NJR-2017a BBW]